jgi:hypothetical protein
MKLERRLTGGSLLWRSSTATVVPLSITKSAKWCRASQWSSSGEARGQPLVTLDEAMERLYR